MSSPGGCSSRFGVGLAGLCVFTAVPSLTALGSLRDGVGMLSTLSALSGLCRITIAVMRKERLGVDHLNSWDEAAAYYAVSVLARMMTGVMS
ncbi:MAG: hypothetical protein WDN49_09910 [Acetobacteraceae bacterium]